jgi:excinuclease UvrABC helicase subunit UvrB
MSSIFSAESPRDAVRVELFDDTLKICRYFLTLAKLGKAARVPRYTVYPGTHM